MTAAERLAALAGRWRTVRAIRQADGALLRFAGDTIWQPEGDHMRCTETGTLGKDGQVFEARRETLWAAAADQAIDIRFADGRPFHRLDASGQADHDCPPDIYRLCYDFSAWPRWSVRWRVTGPRKAYRALTRYRRP
ncbi:MAG: DUF6314 family protein [Pseudomonadota bacterium]